MSGAARRARNREKSDRGEMVKEPLAITTAGVNPAAVQQIERGGNP